MNRADTSTIFLQLTLMLCALLIIAGCEDEAPSIPRGGIPPAPAANAPAGTPAKAAPQKNAANTTKKSAGAAKALDKDGPNPVTVTRAPKASDVLGLDGSYDKEKKLAALLRSAGAQKGPNPLFKGSMAKPSDHYASMKINPINVSPIERKWGGANNQGKKNTGATPKSVLSVDDPRDDNFLVKKGEKAASSGDKSAAGSSGKATGRFELLMYRLDKKTGRLETFKRAFTTKEARDSAAKFAQMSGYSETAPSKEVIDKIRKSVRDSKEAADAKKAAEIAAKKAKEKEDKKKKECAFKATWYVGTGASRTSRTQCFDSQASLNAFMAARQKAAQTPKTDKKPDSKPQSNDSLAPVKIK